ncbi:hypothetical protein PAERUG_P53_London_9_VIM_2_02_13_01919 [Pseudomonas aeruginosa]|nr:hypothetical protein PAERUG_P53_London_9_VIM_2_02_13_01919 [Pseudomonas aeruginosa]
MEVHGQVGILQPRRAEWRTAGNVGEFAGAEGEQPVAVADQGIEHTFLAIFVTGRDQHRQQHLHRHRLGESPAHAVQQVAEGRLAVGLADRAVETGLGLEVGQLAIVREGPVAPTEFADEGVGVAQPDLADVGLADVPDDRLALDREALHQPRHLRIDARQRVLEQPHAASFVEGDAPTVAVRAGTAAALHQSGEAEDDVRRDVGAHAQ